MPDCASRKQWKSSPGSRVAQAMAPLHSSLGSTNSCAGTCVWAAEPCATRSPSSSQSSLLMLLTLWISPPCSHGCPPGGHGHQHHSHRGAAAVEPAAVGGGKLCPHPYAPCRYTGALLQLTFTSLPSQSPGLSGCPSQREEGGSPCLGFYRDCGKNETILQLEQHHYSSAAAQYLTVFQQQKCFYS